MRFCLSVSHLENNRLRNNLQSGMLAVELLTNVSEN